MHKIFENFDAAYAGIVVYRKVSSTVGILLQLFYYSDSSKVLQIAF